MSNEEFSNEFDILINSFKLDNDGISLSFDEYEKSVFLTKAQDEIVEGLYTGKLLGESFESSEQVRRYLAPLVITASLPCIKELNGVPIKGLSDKSVFAVLPNYPNQVWFITYESVILNSDCTCIDGREVQVIPVTQDEYHRVKRNPFRKPNSRKVLRLDINDSMVELISEEDIGSYLIRYISRPEPIILTTLPDILSISNETGEKECRLNPGTHRMILEVAVNMAIRSRIPGVNK